MKKIKILILRNFTIEPLLDDINEKLKIKNLKAEFLLSNYENTINNLMNKKSQFYNFKPDMILFFFSLDAYFKNIIIKKNKKKINNKIKNDLNLILSLLKKNFVTEIGVCNFYESFDKRNISLSQSLNKKIRLFCKNNSNFTAVNIHEISKNNYLDKRILKFWKQSMYPFSYEIGNKISNLLFKFLALHNGKFHKIIILDADNTLWPGIIGEDNPKKIEVKKKNVYSFFQFQKDLKELKNKGVLLAICSKNNLKELKSFFRIKSKKMPLVLNDFCNLKVNWKKKSENILQLLNDINLSAENALFIDDSEFEIGEVKSRIPNLDTLLVPKKISKLKDIFLQKGNFNIQTTTSEDKQRIKLYLDENKRKKIISKFDDNNEYIKSLKINLEIKLNSKKNINRLSQMTQKTNQFNSTTLRLNNKKILKLILNKDYLIYQCKAKDNFGDYGIIGLAIIKINKKISLAKVENTLFSCRALGRKIEEYFYQKIMNELKQKKIQTIEFNYIKSEKNKLIYDFLNKYTFLKNNMKNGMIVFKKDINKIDFTKDKKLIKYC